MRRGAHIEVAITALGGSGDGLARLPDGRVVFVPLTAPGDTAEIEITAVQKKQAKGQLTQLLGHGPQRVRPPCPHFGQCGGCQLQHIAADFYSDWKRQCLLTALERQGLPTTAVRPMLACGQQSRRRARFAAVRHRHGLTLGLHRAQSKQVIGLQDCHVVRPSLLRLVRQLTGDADTQTALPDKCELHLTETETGLDLWVATAMPLRRRAREALARLAARYDLARLSWGPARPGPELVVQNRLPLLHFSSVAVSPPPHGFLQATAIAEAKMAAEIDVALTTARPKRALDLFSGCGTFSFTLARHCPTHAVDLADAALAALSHAAHHHPGLKPISTEMRDLYRRPPSPDELNGYDLVLFDPPRQGAADIATALAASKVQQLVAISCNAVSFAADARKLVDGGFKLTAITPIDQFPWSPHLELVARLQR